MAPHQGGPYRLSVSKDKTIYQRGNIVSLLSVIGILSVSYRLLSVVIGFKPYSNIFMHFRVFSNIFGLCSDHSRTIFGHIQSSSDIFGPYSEIFGHLRTKLKHIRTNIRIIVNNIRRYLDKFGSDMFRQYSNIFRSNAALNPKP